MGLSRMEETQDIAAPLQLLVEILMVAGGGFHSDKDLFGKRIQLAQFLFPDLPTLPGIGEGDRLDHHAFVRPTHAARTRLASDIHPTDVFDARFLLRRRS